MRRDIPDTVTVRNIYRKPDVPLYGIVAALGGVYSVIYQARVASPDSDARGASSSGYLSGYSPETFRACPDDMPVVRFDLASDDALRVATAGAPLTGWARFDKYVAAGVPLSTAADMRTLAV